MTDFNDQYADIGGFGGRPPRAGWQDGLGLRGLQPPSDPTIQGDLVFGHGRRYAIHRQPRPIVIYTEQPRKGLLIATCPPIDDQLQLIVSGIMACPAAMGAPPNGTFTLTYSDDAGAWQYSDEDYLITYSCDDTNPPTTQELIINGASGGDQWFFGTNALAGSGQTIGNSLICGGPDIYGNSGSATWSIIP